MASLQDLLRPNSQLVLHAPWDPQSLKADEYISDVVTGPQTIDKTSCCSSFTLYYMASLMDEWMDGQYN